MNTNASLQEILEIAQKIASDELAPRADEVDKTGRWPEKSIRALQQVGLGGLAIPSELGGHGQGLIGIAKVCEILGSECASTAMCFGMHLVGSAVLAAKATPHQKEHYIDPIVKGKHLTTLSLSEPGTGSHFYIPEAKLTDAKNGNYTLNGTKAFVTNGGYADSYVISAVIPDPDTPVGQLTCVVVENRSKGLNWKEEWKGIGMKGNSSRSVEMKELQLSKHHLLGEKGDQIWYVFEVIAPYFLTAMAGTYLGIAASAVEEATGHLKGRSHTHTGAALSHQPVLQHRLGTLWAKVESVRQLLYSAAEKADKGLPDALYSILSSKAEVSDCVVEVVNEVMSLMGGRAYSTDGKLSRHLRDARASHVMAPTTDLLRTWTGRALLELPLLGD